MNVDAELVDEHPVFDVAVQAVRLFSEDGRALLFAHELHHLSERSSTSAGGSFDIDEFLEYGDSVLLCVVAQELNLGWNREAVAFLFWSRDAGVHDRRAGC